MLVLFYACLLLYASAPLRFYASTPLQLYASNGARTLNQSLSNLLIIFPTAIVIVILLARFPRVFTTLYYYYYFPYYCYCVIIIVIGIGVGIVIVIAIVIVIIIIIIIIIIKSYIYCSFKGPRVFTTLSAEKVGHQAI